MQQREARPHGSPLALQGGDALGALVHGEPIFHIGDTPHYPDSPQQTDVLGLQHGAAQGHPALRHLNLDCSRMRHGPAESRTDTLGEHLIGDLFRAHARAQLEEQTARAVLQIPCGDAGGAVDLAQPARDPIVQHRAPAPPMVGVEQEHG